MIRLSGKGRPKPHCRVRVRVRVRARASYYEEWFDEVTEEDGWIALLNFREHVIDDMKSIDLDSYFVLGGELNELGWRTLSPAHLYERIDDCVNQRFGVIG